MNRVAQQPPRRPPRPHRRRRPDDEAGQARSLVLATLLTAALVLTLTPPASGAHAAVEEASQAVQVSSAPPAKSGGSVASNWVTPVPAMEIIKAFDPPDEPWLKGHRGIDVLAVEDEPLRAPTTGSIRFAGTVAGSATVSVRTDSGHVLTFQPATSPLEKGERSEEHTSELQSRGHLVCRLL